MTQGFRGRRRHGIRFSSNKQNSPYLIGLIALAVLLVVAIVFVIYFAFFRPETDPIPSVTPTDESEATSRSESEYEEVLSAAERMAAQYDYDGAVSYVQKLVPGYEEYIELSNFVSQCQAKKTKLVKWADNTQITHVFFHSLIADTGLAFSSDDASDYNEVMTTIDEFLKILESMYEKGFVLVHLSDIARIVSKADGTKAMTYQPIYLPSGKKPFVLSVDDLCYYEYMTGDGYPSRLVVDENGRVVNEMEYAIGGTTIGAYDVVPLLDLFVEEHPDFSYHGAKGTVALTGYNGILGYRTSYITYGSEADYQAHYQELFVGPNFDTARAVELAHGAHLSVNPNIEADRQAAAQVAAVMRENGWKFASHTWGHMDMSTVVVSGNAAERFYRDTQWWNVEVAPLVGGTDIIIFSYGADIGSWRNYSDTNQAFLWLKSMGFDYYCNVDSSKTAWVQLSSTAGGTGYLRQGRRNLDGQLMFKQLCYPEKNILYDLFDPLDVFDRSRPLPVRGVTLPEGYDPATLFDR